MERTRKPTSPGQIIKTHYLEPLNMTLSELARNIGVSNKKMAAILDGQDVVDTDMAMRLSLAFCTTPELWLNLQSALDLWVARQQMEKRQSIKPVQGLDAALIYR